MATLAGVFFAVFAFFAWREVRDIKDTLRKETEKLEGDVGRMFKANQKLMAGYERALAKNFDEAIKLYNEAREIYPRLYNVNNALGWAYLEMNQVYAAIEAFRTAKATRPEDIEPYSDLAYAYLRAHDIPGALREIAESLAKDPSQGEYYKGDLYKDLQDNPQFQRLIGTRN